MKARIRKNQKDWHVYIFWILLGVFALLVIMDAFSEDKFDRLPLILCFLPLTILQLRPYQITDRDMLHGRRLLLPYGRRHREALLFLSGRQGRIYFDLTTN